ncbi:hypothetical protein [uncultured Microbacterium sp.]|uniref:hypothetical protein n=1 Tax=uncultured Microbacterium sp. TaxID=191216 RepID=UPI0025E1178D|nr:hypothetical protein [uncultured Microbacterium sp.]
MKTRSLAYRASVRWDRLFEDLETQLASEWEAERQALDTEAERLRLARLPLRDRLLALGSEARIAVRSASQNGNSDDVLSGVIATVGADFAALRLSSPLAHAHHDAGSPAGDLVLVRLDAPWQITLSQEDQLRSARPDHTTRRSPLADRMTFGFVLRDIARKRLGVRIATVNGTDLSGTIDRVAADHLDLALHEPGEPRRSENVRGFSILSFSAVTRVRIAAPSGYDVI